MHVIVRELSVVDAAYIAGLIDGEGTVTLTRLHRRENRRIVTSISNNDRPLLVYVMATVGAGKITGKRVCSKNHAPSFTWQIASRQALGLLQQVLPYLRTYKARRAALVLTEYVACTPRNGKYDEQAFLRRQEFERRFFALTPPPSLER